MRIAKHLIALSWVVALSLSALAPLTPAYEQKVTGKDLYKQNCRICHDKGSPNGEFSPITLIQDQWRRFFKNKFVDSHKDAVLPVKNQKLLEVLTPDQINAIEKFCVDHAADSEQPQTCS